MPRSREENPAEMAEIHAKNARNFNLMENHLSILKLDLGAYAAHYTKKKENNNLMYKLILILLEK